MKTPLLLLLLLVTPWAVLTLLGRIAPGLQVDAARRGSLGLALLFVVTGASHFSRTATMATMLPGWVPAREAVIHLSGVVELLLAVALLLPAWRRFAGWASILLLIALFPANVYAALVRAPMGGHAWGPVYLWIRAPLQAIFIAWAWWFAVRGGGEGPGRPD